MSYPIPLSIKQCNSLINDLLVRFLLAYAGGEIRRVGVHLKITLCQWRDRVNAEDGSKYHCGTAVLMVCCDSTRKLNSCVANSRNRTNDQTTIGEIANEFAITCDDWGCLRWRSADKKGKFFFSGRADFSNCPTDQTLFRHGVVTTVFHPRQPHTVFRMRRPTLFWPKPCCRTR